jgi:hypothetical protein
MRFTGERYVNYVFFATAGPDFFPGCVKIPGNDGKKTPVDQAFQRLIPPCSPV